MEKFTAEWFNNFPIKIQQPDTGYRYSSDAVLLADHINVCPKQHIIEIGCGSGIISILLAAGHPDIRVTGIEIQKELAGFAQKNIVENHLEKSVSIFQGDVNDVYPNTDIEPADIVVSNPPYKKRNTGRLNPDRQKAIARHEVTLDLEQFLTCSKRLLKPDGKLYMIYPANRISELMVEMNKKKFHPQLIRFVHSKTGGPAKMVIISASKNGNGTTRVAPPLFLDQVQSDT